MSELLMQYTSVRQDTIALCTGLQAEDYVPQSALFTSPPKWHLAHTSWFFEEMILKRHLQGYREYDPDFGFLFNSYYQTIGNRANRAERGLITRPSVASVYSYRQHVDEAMQRLLTRKVDGAVAQLVILGLNHEQQHQELLLSDLKYTFSLNPIHPVYDENKYLVASQNTGSKEFVAIAAGVYEIGYGGDGFCFDNELGRHKTYVPDFSICNHLVTNAEFMEFIAAGGYRDFRFWLDEGWAWVQEQQACCPLYWQKREDTWFQYSLAGLQPIHPQDILAHISFYEAHAYATWRGMRLPTEQEWEIASQHLNWGDRWEWTYSAYMPYPGFAIASGAVGEYNGKFMINQMVLRGASVATPKGHSRTSYRNFFHPQARWQFSGIRLAK